MKIVTLVENTTLRSDLCCEHGLSLYIETGKYKLLFDAGQSDAFAKNADILGVDLASVDFAILSHGHYDHGGGLPHFLARNHHAPVYLSCHAFEPHYNASNKYIGLDPALQSSDRLIFSHGTTQIAPGIALHTLSFPPADTSGLTVMENGVLCPEDFRHEHYLMVEENGKRILFSGCSHKGILNIARHFRPDVLIGGFHFMKLQEEATLLAAAEALKALPTRYYTGHCTGQSQFQFLKERMGDQLHPLSTGSVITL